MSTPWLNYKVRYGLQLCGKVRERKEDPTQGYLKDIQKAQNKLFKLLNNTRINDRINTNTIINNLNMSSGFLFIRSSGHYIWPSGFYFFGCPVSALRTHLQQATKITSKNFDCCKQSLKRLFHPSIHPPIQGYAFSKTKITVLTIFIIFNLNNYE